MNTRVSTMKKQTQKQSKVSDIALQVAERLRSLRMKAGITQAELASRAGVTVETVARLERVLRGRASANANPSLETMSNLAGALGVDAVDLLERGPAPKGDRIAAMVRLAKPETRRRIAAVMEALLRDEKLQRKAG